MSAFLEEVRKRRTFAIISHPDAGKTTITEKVLLFGHAIQRAGTVKGRGSRITSYNVCYTKLLRFMLSPSCVHDAYGARYQTSLEPVIEASAM